jgi:AbrB family looped-hinge helix DNA binding protein
MQEVTTTTTITPKYQMHIPVAIRNALKITTHGKAEITAKDGLIIIKPAPKSEVMKLAGTIKVPKNIDVSRIRDHIDYSDI